MIYMYAFKQFLTDWYNYFSNFQILNKKKNDIYKGVHSTAISKTIDYYRLCMDEEAISKTGIAPVLKV